MGTQVHSFCRSVKLPWVAGVAVFLSGCWVPPSASVRPEGRPGVVARAIAVDRVADTATVESVDPAARTIALRVRGGTLPACKIGRGVRNWRGIRAGDQIRATVREVLTVYVAPADENSSPNAGVPSRSPQARVLVVDPSYRVLTVQYANGATEALKIRLHTRMEGIEAGDSVAIRPVEVIGLRVRRHSMREGSSLPRQSATSAG